jgi:hypothetical protein
MMTSDINDAGPTQPATDIAALCERLARGFEDASEFTVVVDKTDLRAALAELERLSAALPDPSVCPHCGKPADFSGPCGWGGCPIGADL